MDIALLKLMFTRDIDIKPEITGISAPQGTSRTCLSFRQVLNLLQGHEKEGSLDLICQTWADQLLFQNVPDDSENIEEIVAALSVFSTALRARVLRRTLQNEKVWIQTLDHLAQMISKNDKKSVSLREAKARHHLAMASNYRKNENPVLSLLRSKKALALTNKDSFLRGEALYAVALSLSLIGRSFESLSTYMQARKIPTTTPYRRMLCALNEAHERLILSDLEGVRMILPELPAEAAFRLQLQLDLLQGQGNLQNHRAAIKNLDLLPAESGPTLLLLIEDALLADSAIKNLDLLPAESGPTLLLLIEDALLADPVDLKFLEEAFLDFKQHSFWKGSEFSAVLGSTYDRFLSGKTPYSLSKDERANLRKCLQLKDYIDLLLHRTLCSAALGQTFMDDWRELNEIIVDYRMFTPMIPLESQCLHPRYDWHGRFAKSLGFSNQTSHILLLNIPDSRIIYGNMEIDLSKQPKTLELLQALAEFQPIIHKSKLHQSISGSKYVSHLHDQRLRMLLGRLREKLHSSFGVDLFHLPGDNCIHLKMTIQSIRRIQS